MAFFVPRSGATRSRDFKLTFGPWAARCYTNRRFDPGPQMCAAKQTTEEERRFLTEASPAEADRS
jgi:hypothetical protein